MALPELLSEIYKLSATEKIKLIRILAEQLDINILNSELQESEQVVNQKLFDLSNEPFVGMWSDRSEMDDSVQWVRNMRNQEWGFKYE